LAQASTSRYGSCGNVCSIVTHRDLNHLSNEWTLALRRRNGAFTGANAFAEPDHLPQSAWSSGASGSTIRRASLGKDPFGTGRIAEVGIPMERAQLFGLFCSIAAISWVGQPVTASDPLHSFRNEVRTADSDLAPEAESKKRKWFAGDD